MDSIRTVDEAPSIESAIQYFYRNRRYTDFRFISADGREEYQVHKLVLAIHSHVLSRIVFGSLSCENIRIETVTNLALQNMIRYFYGEQLLLENISDIKETKAIADKYEIIELGRICKRKLGDVRVNISNVLTVLETAKEFQNGAKEKECLRLIGENQDAVLTCPKFTQMQFQYALSVFEKLRDMNMMTEAVFLRSAIKWLKISRNASKKNVLMQKVTIANILLNDYLDIIQFHEEFFTNTEISAAVKEIRSRQMMHIPPETERRTDMGTNTETKKSMDSMTQVELETPDIKRCRHFGTNTEAEKNDGMKKKVAAAVEKEPEPERRKLLTIQILGEEDGVNVYNMMKRARIAIQDSVSIRSLQIGIDDVLKKGLLGSIAESRGSYTSLDVDISYEGIYYMIRSLKELDHTLTPTQYIEVLKAALHFQIQDLVDKCIIRINGIVDYDPVFLDGLRSLPYFEDKCLPMLLSQPLQVILHPNFINCSADLIMLLLRQDEIRVKDESQLLLVIISWLEARKRDRRHFRSTLLKHLAFENISARDFKYAIMYNPTFFTSEEQKFILAYRNAVGGEVRYFRDKLPEWYNFKSRRIL